MKYNHLKNAVIISVVFFCLCLIAAATQFALASTVSPIIYKLMGLTVACAVLFGLHFWTTEYQDASGFQKNLLSFLHIELVCSLILVVIAIFMLFNPIKTAIIFGAFQLTHGVVYFCNMFLYDEKPTIHRKTLSDEEILKKSNKKAIDSAIQSGD